MNNLPQKNATFLKMTLQGWQLIFVTIMLITGSISIAITQIALGAALVLQIVRCWVFKESLPQIRMQVAVGILAAWALVMIPFSSDSSQSLVYYRRFYLFSALWVTAAVAVSETQRKVLLAGLISGSAVLSIWGMVKAIEETGGLFSTRMGDMSNPMTSGCLLMLVLTVCLGFVFSRGISLRSRLFISLAGLPIFISLLQTMTRSALLGLLVAVVVMLGLLRPRYLVMILLFGVVIGLLFPVVIDSLLSEKAASRLSWYYILHGGSLSARLEMWQGGWEMLKSNPWTGVGDCDLTALAPRYYGDENTMYFGHLHSNPVMFAVIWGWPGFALAMGLLSRLGYLLVKGFRSFHHEPWASAWVLGAMGAWAAFFTAGMSEWYFGDAESLQLFLAIAGIALGSIASKTGEQNG